MNTLHIDTRNNKEITVTVTKKGKEYKEISHPDRSKADAVLELIQRALNNAGISFKDLDALYCEKGPGSFTGLRVGFAIANSLSLALLIPLNDNEIGTIDTPVYS